MTAATSLPLLELRALTRTLPSGDVRLTVLEGVDLRVERGESIAILGPSGSGKSTLLGLMAGLDRPTSGQVIFDGERIDGLGEDALARLRRRRIGFVFQSFQLLPGLTALENVMVPLELLGRGERAAAGGGRARHAIRDEAARLLASVGLAARATHLPTQLSGGEQQRVAIARAFAHGPDLLLADEPTGNLDSASGALVLDLLEGLRRARGTTLVLVTHDPAVARGADRLVHLRDGRIDRIETQLAGSSGPSH